MMKLLFFVAVCVFFVQTCFGAPRTLSDGEIQEIRTGLSGVSGMEERNVGMETKSIETIIDTLKEYRDNPIGFLSLAMQGDTCTKNKIDLKHIVAVANNKSDEEIIEKYGAARDMPGTEVEFTNDQLKVIEADLNKHHPSAKVQHAMKILKGFQPDASTDEKKSTAVDLLMSAAKAVSNGCRTQNSPNNQL